MVFGWMLPCQQLAGDLWVCLGAYFCRNRSCRVGAAGWDPAVQALLPGDVGDGAAARSVSVCYPVPYGKMLLLSKQPSRI